MLGKASFNIRILLKSSVRKAFYVCLLLVLTRAFMSTNRSSSSARRTDAVPLNSFITGRYLKRKKNEVKKYRPAPEAEESRSFLTYLHWQGFAYGKIPLPGQLLSCRFVALPYLSPTLSCYKRRKTWHSAWKWRKKGLILKMFLGMKLRKKAWYFHLRFSNENFCAIFIHCEEGRLKCKLAAGLRILAKGTKLTWLWQRLWRVECQPREPGSHGTIKKKKERRKLS